MDSYYIRWGETATIPIDTGDTQYTSADIYIGKPGQVYTITAHAVLTAGKGSFVIPKEQTKVPIDTYYYQINVTGPNNSLEKFPSPEAECDTCDDDVEFPKFVVADSLDKIEVS